jgi:hypothetical protein
MHIAVDTRSEGSMLADVKPIHCLVVLPLLLACRHNHGDRGPMERAGAGVDHAADATGRALSGAARKTGEALDKAGHATGKAFQHAGDKLSGHGSDSGDAPPAKTRE